MSRNQLLERARHVREALRSCQLCEFRCGANRIEPQAGERTPCGLGEASSCFKRHLSYAEEIEIVPSYMVYFAGCNFRCQFCVQAPTCFDPIRGELVEPGVLAEECARQIAGGAKTVNVLGGEPSLHLHTILELAAAAPIQLALLLNSNFYMTPEVLNLLDGVIEYYVADFKFGNDDCATRIAGVDRYVEVVTRNLLIASRQSDAKLIVRHLLMPGHLECCYKPVAQWMRDHLPGTQFQAGEGYVPAWRAASSERAPELSRTLSGRDLARASEIRVQLRVNPEVEPVQ